MRVLAVGSLSDILPRNADVNILSKAGTIDKAQRDAELLQPDVAVITVGSGHGRHDLASVAKLHTHQPQLRIVAVSDHSDEERVLAAFAAGVRGVVVRASGRAVLREALHAVAGGGTYLDPAVAEVVVKLVIRQNRSSGGSTLTPQERNVLRYLPRGLTNREIAEQIGVSEHTVKTHVSSLLRKLRVRDRAQAAAVAVREGLV